MEENKKGGKRTGAGRKPSDNPRVPVTLYVAQSVIDLRYGDKEALKESIYAFLDSAEPPTTQKEVPVSSKKEALSEMISGIKPSGLKFKNNPGAVTYDAVSRSKILAEIKEWEEKKCPSYMPPLKFKAQKEEAILSLKNQLK